MPRSRLDALSFERAAFDNECCRSRGTSALAFTPYRSAVRATCYAGQILNVLRHSLRYRTVIDIQPFLAKRDQAQFGEHLQVVGQSRQRDCVFRVHLTAEQFIVLSDMRVDRETIRISERFADLSHLVVRDSRHTF